MIPLYIFSSAEAGVPPVAGSGVCANAVTDNEQIIINAKTNDANLFIKVYLRYFVFFLFDLTMYV